MSDITLNPSDRAVLIGANGTGKSTLAAYLLAEFRRDNPGARILVLDTKPRWRGVKKADGTSVRRLYRAFAKGDVIPGAVSMQRITDWPLAWDRDLNPTQTVIAQRVEGTHALNMRYQIACAERYFKTQTASRPSLIYLDEGMDFFTPTSGAVGGSDIVQRCYRAGRERGLCTVSAFQRPVGINKQCLTELNYCALFRINNEEDVKRLHEMGWPRREGPPDYTQPHAFKVWREGRPEAPAYRLTGRAA